MSRMRSFLKPPLPKSPIRLRSRHVLQTPGSLSKRRVSDVADLEPKLPFDYSSIASEIHELANKVKEEFSKEEDKNLESLAAKSVPVFERGRFYEEYSAKRNERLKRKKGEEGTTTTTTPYKLGVNKNEAMSITKRRGTITTTTTSKKKTAIETTASRYSLRSTSKENRKPPVPFDVSGSAMKSVTNRRGRRL